MARNAGDGAADVPFMGNGGTLNVKGKTYAIGLFWDAAKEPKNVLRQARQAAAASGADLVTCRKPDHGQYGLGSSAAGHQRGMVALAALVADSFDGDMLAAFEVPGGYYIVAVREKHILADSDRLLTDKAEAVDYIGQLALQTTWDTLIAPADFSIDEARPIDLDLTIASARTKAKLDTVSQVWKVIRIGFVAAVLIAGYLGYTLYFSYEQGLNEESERQRMLDEMAARQRNEALKPKPMPFPWIGQLRGYDVVMECRRRILAVPLDAAGWTTDSILCVADPGSGYVLHAYMSRHGGTVNWAKNTLSRMTPAPHFLWKNDNIDVFWDPEPLPPSTVRYEDGAPTSPIAAVQNYLAFQFDEMRKPVSLSASHVEPPPQQQRRSGEQFPPPYDSLAIRIEQTEDPSGYAKILAPLPVLTVQSVKLDITRWQWTIEGKAYAETSQDSQGLGQQPGASRP